MVETIVLSTSKDTANKKRTFDLQPKAGGLKIKEAIHAGHQMVKYLDKDGNQKEGKVVYELFGGDCPKIELQDNGLSQALLFLIFQLILTDSHLSREQLQDIKGKMCLNNSSSFFSRVRTPNVNSPKEYYETSIDLNSIDDARIELEEGIDPEDISLYVSTNLLKSVDASHEEKILNSLPLNVRNVLLGAKDD